MATATMPRPKSDKDSQVTIVLPGGWLDEAQQIADARSEPGLVVTRSDIIRMALRRGLDELASTTPAPKRKR
jgi:hypothetical protein